MINTLLAHWQQMQGSPNAHFFSYDAFLIDTMLTPDGTSLTPDDYFTTFYQAYLRDHPCPTQKPENPVLVFEEICHRAACANDKQYKALGKKQSQYDGQANLQDYICNLYREYQRDLTSRNYVDSALFSATTVDSRRKRYLAIFADESQDLRRCQHDVLAAYAGRNLLLFNGSHQSIAQTTDPVLLARTQHTPNVFHLPPLSHRCSKAAARVANAVIEIKDAVCGKSTNQPLIQTRDNAIEGEVCFAQPERIQAELLVRATEPGAVFITTETFLQEAKQRFPGNVVATVAQFKGLECRTVYLYKLFHDNKHYAIINQLLKTNAPILDEYKPYQITLDIIITALSRTTDWICVIDDFNGGSLKAIFNKLRRAAANTAEAAAAAETPRTLTIEDRRAFISQLILGGLADQAQQEWLRHCGSLEEFHAFADALGIVQTPVEPQNASKSDMQRYASNGKGIASARPELTILDFLKREDEDSVQEILRKCNTRKSLAKLLNTVCGLENKNLDTALTEDPLLLGLFTRCFINIPKLFKFDLPEHTSIKHLQRIQKELDRLASKHRVEETTFPVLSTAIINDAGKDFIIELLEMGASPTKNGDGSNHSSESDTNYPLAACILKKAYTKVTTLIKFVKKPGELPEALFLALEENDAPIFLELCKFKEDLDAVQNNRSLPYCAAENNRLNILYALKLHGIDLNLPSHYGLTPFCIATLKQHTNIINFFLQYEINPHKSSIIDTKNLKLLLSDHKISSDTQNTFIESNRDPSDSDKIRVSPFTLAKMLNNESITALFNTSPTTPDTEPRRRELTKTLAKKIATNLIADFDKELVPTLLFCAKQPVLYKQLLIEEVNGKTVSEHFSEEPCLGKLKDALVFTQGLLGKLDLSALPKLNEFHKAGIVLGAFGKALPDFFEKYNPLLFAYYLLDCELPLPTGFSSHTETLQTIFKQVATPAGVARLATCPNSQLTFITANPLLTMIYITNHNCNIEESAQISPEQRETLVFLAAHKTGLELINEGFTPEKLNYLMSLLRTWQEKYPDKSAIFPRLINFNFGTTTEPKTLKEQLYQNKQNSELFAGCFLSLEANLRNLDITTLFQEAQESPGHETLLKLKKILQQYRTTSQLVTSLTQQQIMEKIKLLEDAAPFLPIAGTHLCAAFPVIKFLCNLIKHPTPNTNKLSISIINLIKKYEDPGINGLYEQNTPLIYAITAKNNGVFDALLQLPQIKVNFLAPNGVTALTVAVKNNLIYYIDKLLKAGADPTKTDGINDSALYFAGISQESSNGDFTTLKSLLPYVENVNVKDSLGETIIHSLAATGTEEIMEILQEAGADFCVISGERRDIRKSILVTPLMYACLKGNDITVSWLLKQPKMASVINHQNIEGKTAAMIAASRGCKSILSNLIKAEAALQLKDINGQTAFYQACLSRKTEIVSLLASNNPEHCNIPDSQGLTPLCIATELNDANMVEILLNKGADPNICFYIDREALNLRYPKAKIDNINSFITLRLGLGDSEKRIQIKPIDIAFILGHEHIMQLILNTQYNSTSAAALQGQSIFAASSAAKPESESPGVIKHL